MKFLFFIQNGFIIKSGKPISLDYKADLLSLLAIEEQENITKISDLKISNNINSEIEVIEPVNVKSNNNFTLDEDF